MKLRFTILFSVFSILAFAYVPSAVESKRPRESESGKLWEQAIAAKGGRERLYAVRNMVVSSKGKYSHRSARMPIRQEELIVFPDKYWFWNDLRPDVFGLTVEMYNYETNMHYIISPDSPQSQAKPIIGAKRSAGELFLYTQLLYLLETNWLKPTLVRTTAERIQHRDTNVLQTRVLHRRVDFAFDSESHLLIPGAHMEHTQQQRRSRRCY